MKSLREQVAELELSKPQDYDPEEDDVLTKNNSDHSSSEESDAGNTGREHYQEVSKSKLRKPEQINLGKQYSGTAVSRAAIEDEENDLFAAADEDEEEDPFGKPAASSIDSKSDDSGSSLQDGAVSGREDDSEIDSDEAFGTDDEEKFKDFKFRGSKDRVVMNDEEEAINANEDEEEEDSDRSDNGQLDANGDMDMEDAGSTSEAGSSGSSEHDSEANLKSDSTKTGPSSLRQDIKKRLLSNDTATVISKLSAAANTDVAKGKGVKNQYQTFDRLLEARMKLQKGLTASKELVLPESTDPDSEIGAAVQSAETAALRLFSTIESLRNSISDAQQSNSSAPTNPKKRKRPSPASTSTSTSSLWQQLESLESDALPYRRALLSKWSKTIRKANGLEATSRSQLDSHSHQSDQDSITAALDSHLAISTSRSPATSYDDSSFYQSLLRELIFSRASLAQGGQTILSDMPLPAAAKQHRKGVDTKASKGRKVRYTVHEKLQNFCAEEERGTWTEGARREFFGSLFGGQGRLLDESVDVDVGVDDAMEEFPGGAEEGALRLFRN